MDFVNIKELSNNNFAVKFDSFATLILNVINKHASIRRLSRTKQKINSKPWISKAIYEQIRCKRQMYKSHFIKGDKAMKSEYKKSAYNLTRMKTLADKQYYPNELKNSTINTRKTWEVLQLLISGKSHCSNTNILASNSDLNGCSINDKQQIINEFFSKVGKILSNNFDNNVPNNFKQFLTDKVDSSIFREPSRVNKVFNVIVSLSLLKWLDSFGITCLYVEAQSIGSVIVAIAGICPQCHE